MAGIAPPRKKKTPPSVPPRVGSAAAAAAAAERDEDDALSDDEEEELDEETKTEIKDIERIGKEIERVLLRIGTSQEPLADKDLLALKRLGARGCRPGHAVCHTRGGEETCDRGNDCNQSKSRRPQRDTAKERSPKSEEEEVEACLVSDLHGE